MKKIQRLSLISLISLIFIIFGYVTTVSAQACDPNPACDPTSGTCCNQCDPNPACVASDPNAIPCCGGHAPPEQHGHKGDMDRGHDSHDRHDEGGHEDHRGDPGCDPRKGCEEPHHEDGAHGSGH